MINFRLKFDETFSWLLRMNILKIWLLRIGQKLNVSLELTISTDFINLKHKMKIYPEGKNSIFADNLSFMLHNESRSIKFNTLAETLLKQSCLKPSRSVH